MYTERRYSFRSASGCDTDAWFGTDEDAMMAATVFAVECQSPTEVYESDARYVGVADYRDES